MSDPSQPPHPKVFLSYSHDDDNHRSRSLRLAERLRRDGFDTMIDHYVEGNPPQGWPRWMLDQIDWADYILLICTETYYRRFRGHEAPNVGKGGDWEGAIITNELYAKRSISSRFVPVLFNSTDLGYIPEPVRSFSFHVLDSEEAYQRLTDSLAGVAGIQPAELGPPPARERKTGSPLTFEERSPEKTTAEVPGCAVPDFAALLAPGGTMSTDDKFYVERMTDQIARVAASRPCGTVVIKGPQRFGKSSLLTRYLGFCQESGKSVASINFTIFEQSTISNYSDFLTALGFELARRLKLRSPVGRLPRQQRFNSYVESVLAQLDGPVVFGFDQTDHIMQQDYSQDFFAMLRMWHDKRAESTSPFRKLGLALITSSEPKLFIKNPLHSPFNVGEPLHLEPFTDEQTAQLNLLFGAPLSGSDCAELNQFVAGHPFLAHVAFYKLSGPNPISFNNLKREAAWRKGPFGEHLREMLSNVKLANLLPILQEAIHRGTIANEDDFYRLEGAGLVRRDHNNRVEPANQIYADFFRDAQ